MADRGIYLYGPVKFDEKWSNSKPSAFLSISRVRIDKSFIYGVRLCLTETYVTLRLVRGIHQAVQLQQNSFYAACFVCECVQALVAEACRAKGEQRP